MRPSRPGPSRGTASQRKPDLLRAENAARALLRQNRIAYGAQIDLEMLAWTLGVTAYSADLKGAVACLVRQLGKAVIILSYPLNAGNRKMFSLAHELGHYLLHGAQDDQLPFCLEEHFDPRTTRPAEREANAFATELLMPRERWTREAAHASAPDFRLIRSLADTHAVSLSAAALRFVQVSPARCAVAYCSERKVKWSAPSARLGHHIPRGMPLSRDTLALGYLEGHPMPEWPTRVPATAWLKKASQEREDEVIEHCVPMPSLEAALSLVVLPLDSKL